MIDTERIEGLVINGPGRGRPRFISRFNIEGTTDTPPARGYAHEAGFEEYGSDTRTAAEHLETVMGKYSCTLLDTEQFVLAFLWGQKGERIIDMVGFSEMPTGKGWPGNPELDFYVIVNGVYQPKRKKICGDGALVLGAEEEYRRVTKNLGLFAKNPPNIVAGLSH